MKKFITLVLVLVLALGLTVPAMAFTSDTSDEEDHPYGLKIYLVEYDDNDLFGLAQLPESDRGYAKNEIVAAVVELDIPEDETLVADGYKKLEIRGDNVSFNVTDKPVMSDKTAKVGPDALKPVAEPTDPADGWDINLSSITADDVTYKWLVFAKVTDDEASLTAKLIDGDGSVGFKNSPSTLVVDLDGIKYTIKNEVDSGKDRMFTITWTDDGDQLGIRIYVDKDYKSTGMAIDATIASGEVWTNLGVNTKNELGIVSGAVIKTDGTLYEDVMDIYEDVVVDVFGMDYMLIGNYVRESFFEDLVSGDTITATVDIEPWTAYVTVPDNIVVDPPKTGDAASIMGFVMVALSGAGVVALRKRG